MRDLTMIMSGQDDKRPATPYRTNTGDRTPVSTPPTKRRVRLHAVPGERITRSPFRQNHMITYS